MNDFTRLLSAAGAGDRKAADLLFPVVYEELNQMADRQMAGENRATTLCASDLVHEAFLRLIGSDNELHYENRRHFYGAASRAMRQILIDGARRRARARHGGGLERVEFIDFVAEQPNEKLLALEQALNRLATLDGAAAQVVDMHHFAGLSYEKTAELLGTSVYEVRRQWAFARAWLSDQLK
jgi:RNA polymerase sigma factor (TIGR02999 family)